MDTINQELVELVRELPPEAQIELRDFAKSLLAKHRRDEQASALDVLMSSRVGAFKSADEVNEYLRGERESWED